MTEALAQPTSGSRPPLALIGALGVLLVLVGALVVSFIAHNQPFGWDQQWHDLLAAHRSPTADALAYALNTVGGTFVMVVVTFAIVILLLVLRWFRGAITIGLSVALASGICSLIKMAVSRPRPTDGVVDVASDSFPSGHTTTAAALVIALALLLHRVWIWALASAWIVVIAASRTYLLVHWLSDVIAGAMLGASVALVVFGTVRWIASSHGFLKESSPESTHFTG